MQADELRDARKNPYFEVDRIIVMQYAEIIGPNALLLYVVLAAHANSYTHVAFPSTKRLSAIMGRSRQIVYDAINVLKEHELISVEQRVHPDGGQTTNLYTLLPVKPIHHDPSDSDTPVQPLDRGVQPLDTPLSSHKTAPCSVARPPLSSHKTLNEHKGNEHYLNEHNGNEHGGTGIPPAPIPVPDRAPLLVNQPDRLLLAMEKLTGTALTEVQRAEYGTQVMRMLGVASESEILDCYVLKVQEKKARKTWYRFEWLEKDLPHLLTVVRGNEESQALTPLEQGVAREADRYDALFLHYAKRKA